MDRHAASSHRETHERPEPSGNLWTTSRIRKMDLWRHACPLVEHWCSASHMLVKPVTVEKCHIIMEASCLIQQK
ncbi:Uncharacterised protein [Cutibacterium granulosum]|uniref:Uncharacterized protein n=1 Tax=Cutibacterium granulosum TaxID=33011 RepID=A0A239WRF5_9ACTN|nr:Uncharacterised protein [Cutibacterium granulosum]